MPQTGAAIGPGVSSVGALVNAAVPDDIDVVRISGIDYEAVNVAGSQVRPGGAGVQALPQSVTGLVVVGRAGVDDTGIRRIDGEVRHIRTAVYSFECGIRARPGAPRVGGLVDAIITVACAERNAFVHDR